MTTNAKSIYFSDENWSRILDLFTNKISNKELNQIISLGLDVLEQQNDDPEFIQNKLKKVQEDYFGLLNRKNELLCRSKLDKELAIKKKEIMASSVYFQGVMKKYESLIGNKQKREFLEIEIKQNKFPSYNSIFQDILGGLKDG